MKDQRRNAWTRHTGIDSLFNGAIIGVIIAGLLLAALAAPTPGMKPADSRAMAMLATPA